MPSIKITLLGLAVAALAGGCGVTQKLRTDFGDFAGRAVDLATGNTADASARKMQDPYFADERRDGINRLVNRQFGQKAPYTTRYQQIAQTDDNAVVRSTAIRALSRARDASATPLFVKGLEDDEPLVRLESAKALANVPDESAVPALLKVVSDEREARDVRIAAADALRHYRKLEVGRMLANLLDERDFSVAWQAHQTLRRLTGRDLHYDESAWLNYLTSTEKPFG